MSLDPDLPAEIGPPAPSPALPRFRAARAFAVLFAVFVAQIVVAAFIVLGWTIVAVARGAAATDPRVMKGISDNAVVPIALASAIASGIMVALTARFWARDLFRDPSPAGVGWRRASWNQIIVAALAGVTISLAFCGLTLLFPAGPDTPLGPLTKMAAAGGWSRFAWMLIAIVLAPPIEEVLFRGLLLNGLTASWGSRVAYVVVTALFVTFHLFETYRYPIALLGILMLAIGVLVARVKTQSLFPAIALHAAYNATLVVWVYICLEC